MKTKCLALSLLMMAASSLHADNFQISEKGPNYRVWSKTTSENGTNHAHRVVELASGLCYTNSSGQLTDSSEQISVLPNGGAAATQGRHQVYFPADIYDGVIEIVTPDGQHLKDRPLGISYDDGSNTVWIAKLKHSQGELVNSNQVVYPDAFTDLKADLVCSYRRSGFECDLVFRQCPPTPDHYGLNNASTTLQLVTEFINTADPQEVTGQTNRQYHLRDETLKFGGLTMAAGKAFQVASTNHSARARQYIPVYKSWLHAQGRTFLVEEVPLKDLAKDFSSLPVSTNAQGSKITGKLRMASGERQWLPAHRETASTGHIQIAANDVTKKSGVVLDYVVLDSDSSDDFTFNAGTTYFISGPIYFSGNVAFLGGTIVKYPNDTTAFIEIDNTVTCPDTTNPPAIFTAGDDDSVGESMSGVWGGYGGSIDSFYANPAIAFGDNSIYNTDPLVINNVRIYWAEQGFAFAGWSANNEYPVIIDHSQFHNCDYAIVLTSYNEGDLYGLLKNSLADSINNDVFESLDGPDGSGDFITIEQSTLSTIGSVYESVNGSGLNTLNVNNSIFSIIDTMVNYDPEGAETAHGVNAANNGYYESETLGEDSAVTATSNPFKAGGAGAAFYLADNTFRDIGAGSIADASFLTTYAPQDGGFPDTNAPDLGYHYPVNEDSDFDGIPDWWIWQNFGNYDENGTNLDAQGHTLLYDYQNGIDPTTVEFTMRLGNQYFNITNATGNFVVLGGTPDYESVVVNTNNFDAAIWTNYDGIVRMNLGPTDGVYQVWLGLKGYRTNSLPTWHGTLVKLIRTAPQISIITPNTNVVATPYIQLQGFSTSPLSSISYDISNSAVLLTNMRGYVTSRFLDTNTLSFTTNYFQCYDIALTAGANLITLNCTDPAGNVATTNLNFTLDYSCATNPVIQLTWPTSGMQICSSSFTLRGWTSDASASIAAQMTDTNGDTNVVVGTVERTGALWVENLPLAEGTNWVTLWVTNAAGLASSTNITLVKNDMTLGITSFSGDLWQPTVGVSGTVSDTTAAIWVNGVQGTNHGDGTWNAVNVPVTSGGVASFDTKAIPAGGGDPDNTTNTVKPSEIVMESATWATGTHDYMGPLRDEGWELDKTSGNYSSTTGGQYTDHFEAQDTNAVTYYTIDTTTKLSPQSYATDESWQDSDGNSHDYGPGGLFPIAQEEGSFAIDSGTGMVRHWQKDSTVCMVLHTGGRSSVQGFHFFQLTATATEQFPVSQVLPSEQISVAGKMLNTNAFAYEMFPDNAEVDMTPEAFVPYYNFTVDASIMCPYRVNFVDFPGRGSDFWRSNTYTWNARLDAVCAVSPNSTNPPPTTLASITYGFSIATDGTMTTTPPSGSSDIVVDTFEATPGSSYANIHIAAHFKGCCDGELNWVQTINSTDHVANYNDHSPDGNPCVYGPSEIESFSQPADAP